MLTILNSVRLQKAKVTKNWNSESQHSAQQISSCSFQAPERNDKSEQKAECKKQISNFKKSVLARADFRFQISFSTFNISRGEQQIQNSDFRLQMPNPQVRPHRNHLNRFQISDFNASLEVRLPPNQISEFRIQSGAGILLCRILLSSSRFPTQISEFNAISSRGRIPEFHHADFTLNSDFTIPRGWLSIVPRCIL